MTQIAAATDCVGMCFAHKKVGVQPPRGYIPLKNPHLCNTVNTTYYCKQTIQVHRTSKQ